MTQNNDITTSMSQRAVPDWQGARRPDHAVLAGDYCQVEPLTRAHFSDLFRAFAADSDGAIWRYLPYGPFADEAAFVRWADDTCFLADPFFYAIIDRTNGQAVGMASYLRINPKAGSIEVGHINFAPALQRRVAATEAMFLMMRNAFDTLGYRRYEWKCDDANGRSKAAASRLGFSAEGVFRQASVNKGLNRDTAWFSIIDSDWPDRRDAFQTWLATDNFDAHGQQKQPLASLRQHRSDLTRSGR